MTTETSLDIAQSHLREALHQAGMMVCQAQNSLDRAQAHLALSQKAMTDFLKLKYPEAIK